MILEADEDGLAVFGVDPRSGEGAVEAVDRAELSGNDRLVPAGTGLPCASNETVGLPFLSIGSTCEVVKACVLTNRLIL